MVTIILPWEVHFMDCSPSPGEHILICGKPKSGKTTRAFKLAASILVEEPDSYCLVLTNKAKFLRRKPEIPSEDEIEDRILFKWFTNMSSLLKITSERHLYTDVRISCVIVEDIYNTIPAKHSINVIAQIINAFSVFEGCRIIITSILRTDEQLRSFRLLMSRFELMNDGNAESHPFHMSAAKTSAEIS